MDDAITGDEPESIPGQDVFRITVARIQNGFARRRPEHSGLTDLGAGDGVEERRLSRAGGSEQQHDQRGFDVRRARAHESFEMVTKLTRALARG